MNNQGQKISGIGSLSLIGKPKKIKTKTKTLSIKSWLVQVGNKEEGA